MRILALAVALATSPAFVLRDNSFAGLGFRATKANAVRLFGAPAIVRRQGTSCFATWPRAGVQIEFFAFAPADPCAAGTVLRATLSGGRWRTAKGLRVGDATPRIAALYPHATKHRDGWWLAKGGCELENYGKVIARVSRGKVVALLLHGAVCE